MLLGVPLVLGLHFPWCTCAQSLNVIGIPVARGLDSLDVHYCTLGLRFKSL